MSTIPSAVPAGNAAGRLRSLIARLRTNDLAYPLGYMAGLDGARGLMTLGVMLAHTRMALFGGAIVYMDIFFAMSGYLITSILIKDYAKNQRISLKKFYLRRILRLYPALTAMIASFIVLSWLFSDHFARLLKEALLSWFYLMDYSFLFDSPYIRYTGHTWSLAVEEQFYLVWPLLFGAMLAGWGLSRRTVICIFAIAGLFWLWRIYLTASGAPIIHLYTSFDTRADALLIGCGLAVLLKVVDLRDYPRLWRAAVMCLLPLAAASVVAALTMNQNMRWYYYVSPLFGAIPGAITVVALLNTDHRNFMHRLYEHPIPVFIGRICYGLYIWHFPIFSWIESWATERYMTIFLVGWPLTFTAAILSYYFIERPFMRVRPGIG